MDQARAYSVYRNHEVSFGFYARVDEAGQAVPRHTRDERPVLPNLAQAAERDAALQGP